MASGVMICRASSRSGARIWIPLISYHVIEHEGEVTCASDQHQQVPDLVMSEPAGERVGPAAAVDHRTDGIGDSSCHQPQDSGDRRGLYQGAQGDKCEVSHSKIGASRKPDRGIQEEKLKGDTSEGDEPYGDEQPQPEPAIEGNQRDRGVGAGNQEIDGDVIQSAQDSKWPLGKGERVIECAGGVQENQAGAVYREPGNLLRAARYPEQQQGAGAREQQPQQM